METSLIRGNTFSDGFRWSHYSVTGFYLLNNPLSVCWCVHRERVPSSHLAILQKASVTGFTRGKLGQGPPLHSPQAVMETQPVSRRRNTSTRPRSRRQETQWNPQRRSICLLLMIPQPCCFQRTARIEARLLRKALPRGPVNNVSVFQWNRPRRQHRWWFTSL